MKLLKELCHRLSIALSSIMHCIAKCFRKLSKLTLYEQWKVATDKLHFSGGVSGGLTDKNDPSRQQRDQHAKRYYSEVRARNKEMEICAIAKNTNIEKSKIKIAYEHIFINKHRLKKGYQQFDPDYEMAQSWQRLREGKNIQPHDIVLIRHEAAEAEFMAQGYSYDLSHEKACEMGYNYHQELKKWLAG